MRLERMDAADENGYLIIYIQATSPVSGAGGADSERCIE